MGSRTSNAQKRLRYSILVLAAFAASCDVWGKDELPPLPPEPPIEPKKTVVAPPEFTGPIDPQWPPARPEGQAVHLEFSRLYREALLKRRQEGKGARQPVSPELFVERGKIGDFEYLEVILGPVRNPDDPMPLVVLLHGRGGKPTIPSQSFRVDQPLRFFIPQAPDKLGSGYTWLATYTQSGQTQLLTRSLSARVDQLAPAIAAFQRLHPTLGKPIVTGFSQGGMLSFALATRYPSRFAAAFPLAGWLPPALYPDPYPRRKFPYIYAQHPAQDKTIPVEYSRDTVKALRARGLKIDYTETPGGHMVTPAMNEEVYRATQKFLAGYLRKKPLSGRAPTAAPVPPK